MNRTPVLVRGAALCPEQPVQRRAGSGLDNPANWRLREAGPQDAGQIRDFVCGLSVRNQYLRFFAPVAPPSSSLLRALSGGNGGADILVVTDDRGKVVGHGMAVDGAEYHGAPTTEIGLVVADSWQGRGLGTTLLRTLARRASDRGVRTLVMEVLPENRRMLGIIGRRWPQAERERTSDSIIVRAAISKGAMRAADRSAA
jgi:GNAT superfamily N-acetyltransferase